MSGWWMVRREVECMRKEVRKGGREGVVWVVRRSAREREEGGYERGGKGGKQGKRVRRGSNHRQK